ncbi:hypothetical protein K501DRAFT_251237 [Backusella circina FSU 941]|nr:hypothetical protein K501DRAFT_251237 [Backusella circina FSU 941]
MNYESICQEMDALYTTYTQQLNEYRQQCEYTGQQFQRGYLNLARAKFTMGSRLISQHSYDKRMKASLQVEMDQVGILHFKREPCKIVDNKKPGNLRKRLNNNNNSSNSKTETPKQSIRDNPLHWFGLFVSPSLRTSQDHFKLATERLIQQVNLIKGLETMEKRYNELQEAKNAIKLKEHYRQDMVV